MTSKSTLSLALLVLLLALAMLASSPAPAAAQEVNQFTVTGRSIALDTAKKFATGEVVKTELTVVANGHTTILDCLADPVVLAFCSELIMDSDETPPYPGVLYGCGHIVNYVGTDYDTDGVTLLQIKGWACDDTFTPASGACLTATGFLDSTVEPMGMSFSGYCP